jgi:hypothetical protein
VTIASCYLSPEGVVLGADSTSTYDFPTHPHHFNYGQKLFEVGEKSTLGVVTWGLGGLAFGSYRSLIARLSDGLNKTPVNSVLEVAQLWTDMFWVKYAAHGPVQAVMAIAAKPPFDPQNPTDPAARTQAEEAYLAKNADDLVVGF